MTRKLYFSEYGGELRGRRALLLASVEMEKKRET